MRTAYTQGIDLSFRPAGYFWAREHGITLTSDIKGQERRRLYEQALLDGDDDIPEAISRPALSNEARTAIGRLHPAFMGGEYLPDTHGQEVEIARIAIASTTGDVISVYARKSGKRILYRVVDEYGGDTLSERKVRSSIKPLTLVQLVNFFLGAWDLLFVLDFNFVDDGYDPDQIKDFVVSAQSSFYPDFGLLIHARIDAWLDTVRPSDECAEDSSTSPPRQASHPLGRSKSPTSTPQPTVPEVK